MKKKNILKRIKKKNIFLAFLLVFFSSCLVVLAKYHLNINERILYDASDFYFESDLLADNNNKQSYTYKRGIDYIEIMLNNNIDSLRYSEVKINYTVTLTDINGNTVKDKDGNNVNEINGVLQKDKIDSNKIVFDNLPSGIYVLTAISTKPYKKQIYANFILTDEDKDITYYVSDVKDSPILNLTVSTKEYSGNINISWPKGMAPDSTDTTFANVDSGYLSGNAIVSFNANSEYIYRFFKEDASTVYSSADFVVGGAS